MMNKENILFGIVGLLLGVIVGFMFANTVNQRSGSPVMAGTQTTAGLPTDHPPVPGANGGAVPEVQAAIENAKQNPTSFDAQLKAAELYYQIQRYDGAIEYLRKANQLQPDNYEVMVHLGNATFDSEKYDEAEKWYTTALAKKPDDANVRTDLGLTFIFRDKPDYQRAVDEFKKVLALNPDHIQALQNITVAYIRKSDGAAARDSLARLEELDPTNKAIPKLREDLENLSVRSSR